MNFRKLTVLMLLVFLIAGIIYVQYEVQANNNIVKIKVDELNVRSGPGLDFEVIGKINQGEALQIIEEKNKWYKIKLANNNEGWIAGWYTEQYTESTPISKIAEANVTYLNVRSGPSTSFAIIEQIHPETKYPVVEIEGDWVKIQLNSNKVGWVAKWLVNIAESSPSTETLESDFVTIQADNLNVRYGPSTNAQVIGKLNRGTKVEVVAIEEGWYKIKFNDTFGYIASKYATKIDSEADSGAGNENNNDNETGTTTPPPADENKIQQVIVNTNILNLRNGPGNQYDVIGKLNNGDILTVLDKDGDWFYISKNSLPETKGWVANWLVSDYNQVVSNQPTVTILNPGTNLREGPSTSTNVVAIANVGDQFPIIATEGDWYQIQLPDGRKAYVAGWLVTAKGLEQNISRGIEGILQGKKIVIDAGHGGNDQGATGLHFKSIEKDLNLKVAKLLENKLEAAGATVYMTRTGNSKPSLQSRVDTAIIHRADAFVSIHHNTNINTSINGTITYYRDGSDKELAKSIQTELVKLTGTKNLGYRYGDYFVLRENSQVAVIVELAFISNYHDELKARSDKFQENAAEGIFQGLIKYFN